MGRSVQIQSETQQTLVGECHRRSCPISCPHGRFFGLAGRRYTRVRAVQIQIALFGRVECDCDGRRNWGIASSEHGV